MSKKTKSTIRKILYGIFFIAMIGCFIYLGDKYASNTIEEKIVITDYYKNIEEKHFEVVKGGKVISLLEKGNHLIMIGNKNSEYSQKYMEELNKIAVKLNIDKIYYYDIINDKSQANSNYYKIIELLEGNLITTDSSKKNLLAPSFYIVDNGKVKYYNIETVTMKNTETIDSYWNTETEFNFLQEVSSAINKYYLN